MTQRTRKKSSQEAWPKGLAAPTPEFWTQPVQLELSLLTAMAMHGNLCLALRHPQNNGHSRPVITAAIRALGDILVEAGALSAERVAEIEREEKVAPA
jgi:hypothetical protein